MLEVVVRSCALKVSTVPFLAFPLSVSSHVFLFPAVFGFLLGGDTTRRSDSVVGQYLNDILDLSVVVGFLATKRYDETRPLSVSCTRAHVTFPHAQDRVSCTQRYLRLLWQYVAFSQQCSVGGHDRFALLENGVALRRLLYVWFDLVSCQAQQLLS